MNNPLAPALTALQRRDRERLNAIEADVMPALVALRLDAKQDVYVGSKGDLVCFLTAVDLPGRKKEPAILLANKQQPVQRQVTIQLRNLWQLVDPDISGDRKATARNRATQRSIVLELTEHLYGFVTQQDTFRVLDAIYDFAEDLKNARPPQGYSLGQWLQALAEDDMTVSFNGRQMHG